MSDSTWHLGIYDVVNAARKNGFVIYGTGYWAKAEYDIFRLFGLTPLAFANYNDIYEEPQDEQAVVFGTGVSVVTLETAAAKYPTAIFIRGCSRMFPNPGIEHITEAMEQLKVYSRYTPFDPFRYYFLLDCCRDKTLDEFKSQIETLEGTHDDENLFEISHLNNVIITECANISASIMFSNLFKGHSNIVSLPNYMLTLYSFIETYANRLSVLSDFELAVETAAQLPYLFISKKPSNLHFVTVNFTQYFSENGEEIVDCGLVNPAPFLAFLYNCVRWLERFTIGDIFKAIFAAYANTIGLRHEDKEYYICYTSHYSLSCHYPILEHFDRKYLFVTVREPVRAFFSAVRRYDTDDLTSTIFNASIYANIVTKYPQAQVTAFLQTSAERKEEILNRPLKDVHIMFVKFEDMKVDIKGVMAAICDSLDIGFEPVLLYESVNNIPVFNKNNISYGSQPKNMLVTVASQEAMKPVAYDKYMSEFDIVRIKMMTKKLASYFSYGDYDVPFYEELPEAAVEKLLEIPLKFEETLLRKHSVGPEDSYFSNTVITSQLAEGLFYQSVCAELIRQGKPYLIRPLLPTNAPTLEKGGD